jgi:hypothetical protein
MKDKSIIGCHAQSFVTSTHKKKKNQKSDFQISVAHVMNGKEEQSYSTKFSLFH